jgi:hypothetical protein
VNPKRLRANLAAFSFLQSQNTGDWKLANWKLEAEICESHKPHILKDFSRTSET